MASPADQLKHDLKEAFLRDPRRLLTALGLQIDEHRSRATGERDLLVFDGAETEASLVVHVQGERAGLFKRFGGDGDGGDCFELAKRQGQAKTFPEQVRYVAGVYGFEALEEPVKAPARKARAAGPVTEFRVPAANGRPELVHLRMDLPDGEKRIWWSEAGSKGLKTVKVNEIPLWRSWELAKLEDGGTVVICEGEKDAEAVVSARVHAVGTYGATAMPTDEVLRPLARFAIVLWPDNDGEAQKRAGQAHMERIGKRLQALGCSPRLVKWEQAPVKGGAADALAQGGPDLVLDLVAAALPMEQLVVPGLEELPTICITGMHLREMTELALSALQVANTPPALFVRSGDMVRWRRDERSRSIIEQVSPAYLRGRAGRVADWVRTGRFGELPVHPPEEVVADVLALGEWEWPPLIGVTEVAAMRPDGTILNSPGYDPASRLIYAPMEGFEVPSVPDEPSEGEVQNAKAQVLDILAEFPWTGESDLANAAGLMLTPVLRPAISGATPLALLDAPQAGTGKSLLAELVSVIATGRRAAMLSAVRDEDEWRKQLTTVLLGGSTIVVIDNVEAPLEAPSLAKAVTADTWSDRLLGRNTEVVLPVRCVWVATGNNLAVRGDFGRRCYWVRLDAKTSRPWTRTNFVHQDLVAYVREQRGEIVGALLTLARAWFARGCPKPACPSLGNFEEWCRIVGGVLEVAGIEGFLGNLDHLYEQVDQDSATWEAFLSVWHDVANWTPMTTAQLVAKAQEDDRLRAAIPDRVLEPKGEINRMKLGRLLGKHVGLRVGQGNLHLERTGKDSHTKTDLWAVLIGG